jgi:hypothetical protein
VSFAEQIAAFAEKTKLDIDTVHRKVVFDLTNSVIRLSPVKTGRFRNNWNVAKGEVNKSTNDGTGDPTAGLQSVVDSLTTGGVVYITNSLPYAIRLEYGWSKQAPQGMVRVTVVNYEQYLKRALETIK